MRSGDMTTKREILQKVVSRDQSLVDIKSETIPRLKEMLAQIEYTNDEMNFFDLKIYEKSKKGREKKIKSFEEESKFQRTAYNIPILKTIYEDHLQSGCRIKLLTTDILIFRQFMAESMAIPEFQVYSILTESAFALVSA